MRYDDGFPPFKLIHINFLKNDGLNSKPQYKKSCRLTPPPIHRLDKTEKITRVILDRYEYLFSGGFYLRIFLVFKSITNLCALEKNIKLKKLIGNEIFVKRYCTSKR